MWPWRFGIEEEYFITELVSRNVRRSMLKPFFDACKEKLGTSVMGELLQSQIEAVTPPCESLSEARDRLAYLRKAIADIAAPFGLGIVAAGTHPLAAWRDQKAAQGKRYESLMSDFQMIGYRNMLCGMHVHVEVPDPAHRVEIMHRAIPHLPVLLALSTSSPFWQGHDTGLLGYRLAAYDEWPRTGLPELFRTTEEYENYVETLKAAEVIPDASYIWWAIRPSLKNPTIELRIADACARLEDTVCVVALFRCLVRHLSDHPDVNAGLDSLDLAIARENKWRAQRYGARATFVDRQTRSAKTAGDVVRELLDLLKDDSQALECIEETRHALHILERGSSADEQMRIFADARKLGKSRRQALCAVVDWLLQETVR